MHPAHLLLGVLQEADLFRFRQGCVVHGARPINVQVHGLQRGIRPKHSLHLIQPRQRRYSERERRQSTCAWSKKSQRGNMCAGEGAADVDGTCNDNNQPTANNQQPTSNKQLPTPSNRNTNSCTPGHACATRTTHTTSCTHYQRVTHRLLCRRHWYAQQDQYTARHVRRHLFSGHGLVRAVGGQGHSNAVGAPVPAALEAVGATPGVQRGALGGVGCAACDGGGGGASDGGGGGEGTANASYTADNYTASPIPRRAHSTTLESCFVSGKQASLTVHSAHMRKRLRAWTGTRTGQASHTLSHSQSLRAGGRGT